MFSKTFRSTFIVIKSLIFEMYCKSILYILSIQANYTAPSGGLGIVGCVYIKLRRLTIIEFLFTHWEFCMLSLKSWACLWSDWRDWLWENLFFNLNFLWFSFIQVLNLEAKVWMLKVKLFDYSAFKNGSNFHIKHIEFHILFTVLPFFNSG